MAPLPATKEFVYEWEGRTATARQVRGETACRRREPGQASLRRQGVSPLKIKKRKMRSGSKIRPKDIAIFTRQLATMMKAGVPLLQAFDIVGRGNANASVTKLLNDIRADVETGTSLSAAFRKYPIYFDSLYCNLVEAGEAAGILESLLDRLATYMEKTEAIKSKIKSALMYPIAVVVVAFVVVSVIMIFVIPAFKEVFTSFGADLPAPTLFVIGLSEILRQVVVADLRRHRRRLLLLHAGLEAQREGPAVHGPPDAASCRVRRPGLQVGDRALDAHLVHHVRRRRAAGRSAGLGRRRLRQLGVQRPRRRSSRRSRPAPASRGDDQRQRVPVDGAADVRDRRGVRLDRPHAGQGRGLLRAEVDDMVAGLSSLMEPVIIVVLGTIIGGIVVSMYLPIFKLGQVV
jgi:type IV pilus assembly protein PilC